MRSNSLSLHIERPTFLATCLTLSNNFFQVFIDLHAKIFENY